MTSHSSMDLLPTELLVKIFALLNLKDLCHLKLTCKRFKNVINSHYHVLANVDTQVVVTNQESDIFLSRCRHILSSMDKIRISRNWTSGKYIERSMSYKMKKCSPRLHLDDKFLWLSRDRYLYCYRKSDHTATYANQPCYSYRRSHQEQILDFRIKSHFLVCGLRDGGIWQRNITENYTMFDLKHCHESNVYCVDLSNDGKQIVSSSINYLKIWRVKEDETIEETYSRDINYDISKMSLSHDDSLLAVGSYCSGNVDPLNVYDLSSMTNSCNLRYMSSRNVLDLKWDGIHSIWVCFSEGNLKRWDLRTGNYEQSFNDPRRSDFVCMDYDHNNSIMTGSDQDGRVTLWDIRKRNYVQLYFMRSSSTDSTVTKNSSIHSLAFDAESLYLATNRHLNVLDFSIYNGTSYDYSSHLGIVGRRLMSIR